MRGIFSRTFHFLADLKNPINNCLGVVETSQPPKLNITYQSLRRFLPFLILAFFVNHFYTSVCFNVKLFTRFISHVKLFVHSSCRKCQSNQQPKNARKAIPIYGKLWLYIQTTQMMTIYFYYHIHNFNLTERQLGLLTGLHSSFHGSEVSKIK